MTRKELKAPDAFQKAGLSIREWLQERQGRLTIAIALLLVIGAVIALAGHFSRRNELRADKALGAALRTAGAQDSDDDETDEKPADPSKADSRAKDDRLIRELTKLRSQYPRSQAALTTMLPLAEAQLRVGQYDQALASFEEFLKKAPSSELLRAEALEGEGYAYEAKGQLDFALAAFERMSKESKSEFLTGMGDYHRARILVLLNRKQEAATAFNELKSAHPGTAAARQAAERLNRLIAEGIVVAPPKPVGDAGQGG